MTAWDNTARRRLRSSIFLHSSRREYEVWLRAMIAATEVHNPPGERLVFINAWNEWAEGTHLEPDQKYGYAFLEATARAISARTDWRDSPRLVRSQPDLPAAELRQYLSDLEFALESYDRSVNYLRNVSAVAERISAEMQLSVFTDVVPQRLRGTSVEQGGMFFLDKVYDAPVRHPWIIDRGARISVEGWAAVPGIEPTNQDTHAHLVLRSKTESARTSRRSSTATCARTWCACMPTSTSASSPGPAIAPPSGASRCRPASTSSESFTPPLPGPWAPSCRISSWCAETG